MKKIKTIEIGASIFEENDRIAEENRLLLREKGIVAINIMGSPGSGKTSILEKTVSELKQDVSFAVIEGDINGSLDGERLNRFDIPIVQINTGGACHLDANMVAKGLENLPLKDVDILFIENVGNLVCPAEFDIGAETNVIITSTPEGEEKPLKYPLMFKISATCLLNKTDLLEYTDFNMDRFQEYLFKTSPSINLISLSAKTGAGFSNWLTTLTLSHSIPGMERGERIVIAGMGDRMKSDDGAGCEVAEELKKKITRENVKVINAENAIDNYVGVIEKFKPVKVFIVDAVDFGGAPGETKVLSSEKLKETTTSTHTFSLPILLEHVKTETGAECTIIGIQPKTICFGEGLSPEVQQSVSLLVKQFLS